MEFNTYKKRRILETKNGIIQLLSTLSQSCNCSFSILGLILLTYIMELHKTCLEAFAVPVKAAVSNAYFCCFPLDNYFCLNSYLKKKNYSRLSVHNLCFPQEFLQYITSPKYLSIPLNNES